MNLEELRKQVDELDARIVELINKRAETVRRIGQVKDRDGGSIYQPARETVIYEHVVSLNSGPLDDRCVKAIYRELMSGCIALEKRLKIAYLGPTGTFTHAAARSRFGESVDYGAVATLEDVFEEVEQRRADYGVVPVENSTEGGIHETLTRLLVSPLKVCAEIMMEIHHCLLANCSEGEIERIYSRGEVLRQTRRWLRTHLPGVEQNEVSSTSAAAERAAREPHSAAIARADIAADCGLRVLHENIEDVPHNVTRFFVVADHMSPPAGEDKTAILCSVKDKVGALHDLLRPFKQHGINMTKIESFPSPSTPWRYYFFIDFLGHPDEPNTAEALRIMEHECAEFKILGAFPQWKA